MSSKRKQRRRIREYRSSDTIYAIDIINESYDHQKVLVSAHAGFFDVFLFKKFFFQANSPESPIVRETGDYEEYAGHIAGRA